LITAEPKTIAEIAEAVENHRDLDDGTIYVALQRMTQRGFVTSRKTRVVSADKRPRDIGVYTITAEGCCALNEWDRAAGGVRRLRLAAGLA